MSHAASPHSALAEVERRLLAAVAEREDAARAQAPDEAHTAR